MSTASPQLILPDAGVEARRRVRGAVLGFLVALLIQFLAGMLVNLFVTVPDAHPGTKPAEYFGGSAQSVAWAITGSGIPLLVFHAAFGLLLVVGGLAMIPRVRTVRRRSVTLLAGLGFLAILASGFNGASFLDFGEAASSMLMATLFALAMLCYAGILFVLAGES